MSDKQTHSYVTSSVVPNRRHRPHLTFTCHCSRQGGGFAIHTEHAAHCGYTWVLAGRTSQFQQKKKRHTGKYECPPKQKSGNFERGCVSVSCEIIGSCCKRKWEFSWCHRKVQICGRLRTSFDTMASHWTPKVKHKSVHRVLSKTDHH